MEMMTLWYVMFSLFWTASQENPFPFQGWLERFFFPSGAVERCFDICRPCSEGRDWNYVLERNSATGEYRGMVRTRFVNRLFFCDIDKDGKEELVLAVTKWLAGKPWKRVYVYRPLNGDILPQWLGSRLCYRLLSVDVISYKGQWVLSSLETNERKRFHGLYVWDAWGFRTLVMKELEEQ